MLMLNANAKIKLLLAAQASACSLNDKDGTIFNIVGRGCCILANVSQQPQGEGKRASLCLPTRRSTVDAICCTALLQGKHTTLLEAMAELKD